MKVLFVCQLNSVRSPMAEGLLRNRLGTKVHVKSCGLTPEEPNDFMISVMREVGIDIPNPGEGSLDVRALLNNYRAIRSNIDARLAREFT